MINTVLCCACQVYSCSGSCAGKDTDTTNGHGDQAMHGQNGFNYNHDESDDEYEVSLTEIGCMM